MTTTEGHGDNWYTRKRGTSHEQNGEDLGVATAYVNADEDDNHYHRQYHHPTSAEESHLRSFAKGLTWRFVATMTTVTIAWLVTGETGIAFQIGFFEFFAKVGIYYIHERLWARIRII
jgi:uncharacterized membrane protein